MKRIILSEPCVLQIDDIERPSPSRGEALVRIKKVGVCGSDIHLYRGAEIGQNASDDPFVMGHECMGEVVEVGQGVDKALVGRRVAVEPAMTCGICQYCQSGLSNLCSNITFLGLPPIPGALQEYIVHPVQFLETLPDNISDADAVVIEPMAIALHAINLVKVKPGMDVVILGTGVLGTCVLQLLQLYRGLKIVCVDLLSDRLERARNMGATHTVQAEVGKPEDAARQALEVTGGKGAAVVFECCGSKETMWNASEIAAPGGHVSIIGTNADGQLSFSSTSTRRKGLTLRFVRRSVNTMHQCLLLAERGCITPGELVTHTFSSEKASEAFETVAEYRDGVLKALVDMEK
jgi:L-iditol 2-dehydrogenase